MSAWHWQQVPPGLLTARPSQSGPEKSAHSSIYEYVVWYTSDIDELFRFIYRPALRWGRWCRFFRHAMRWRQSDHHVAQWHKHKHTHTHTHTHTHMHARTYFFRNDKKGRVMLFFLSLFSFFFLMLTSISWVTCHSSRLFIMWHPGTNTPWHKQTNTNTHSNHVCTCVLALRLVSRSLVCNNLSTPLNAYGGALVYYFLEQRSFLFSFPLGSLLPFSLPSISFSQVNPPEYYWLLQHSGI